MKKIKVVIFVFSLTIILSGAPAMQAGAFGSHSHGGGMCPLKMLTALDLTDDQKAEVRNILIKYREEQKEIRDRLHKARAEVAEVIHAEPFNEVNIREAIRQISPMMEDMMVLKAKIMAELKTLLNPDQLEFIEKERDEHVKRMGKGMQFRDLMIDTWLQMKNE